MNFFTAFASLVFSQLETLNLHTFASLVIVNNLIDDLIVSSACSYVSRQQRRTIYRVIQARLRGACTSRFKDHMARLPAHSDAVPALDLLKDAGFRMVTLTNTPAAAGKAVLEKAGLAHYFEYAVLGG